MARDLEINRVHDLDDDSYEMLVVRAKARNPRIIMLDAMHTYQLGAGKGLTHDQGPVFTDRTCCAETFVLELRNEKDVRAGAPPVHPTPILRIASEQWPGMPDKNTWIVDEFPLTEATVLRIMVEFLEMNSYFEKNTTFLWGPTVLTKEEALGNG